MDPSMKLQYIIAYYFLITQIDVGALLDYGYYYISKRIKDLF